MSTYPRYGLQAYDWVQKKWIPVMHCEVSSRPHHYDTLRREFERLVSNATEGASANQKPIGYRIYNQHVGYPLVVVDQ